MGRIVGGPEPRWSLRVDVALVVAFAGAAAALRAPALGPASLWLDDSWPALVTKADRLHEVLLAGAWAPGFGFILKGWLGAVGFSELKAQLPPFLLGTVAPPLLYVVLVRRGLGRLAAGVGAFVLMTSSVHITYSVRVKQYTLDAVCVIVLLAVLWWLLEDVSEKRRWWYLAATGTVAIAVSSLSAVVAGSGVAVALLLLVRRNRGSIRVALPAVSELALFGGAWWWFVLRPRVTTSLREEFHARFFGIDAGVGEALRDLAGAAVVVVRGAVQLPGPIEGLVVLAAAVVVLWRRPTLGLLLLAPLALAVVLAAARAAPLGTGRTDVYLYPLLAVLVALAAHEALTVAPRATALALGTLAAASLATYRPPNYPREVVRPLVREVETITTDRDAILIAPKAGYAFGLYTKWPVDLVSSDEVQQGFTVRIRRPNVVILGRLRPTAADGRVERVVRTHDSIWVLASHGRPPRALDRILAPRGFKRISLRREPGASLEHWSRG